MDSITKSIAANEAMALLAEHRSKAFVLAAVKQRHELTDSQANLCLRLANQKLKEALQGVVDLDAELASVLGGIERIVDESLNGFQTQVVTKDGVVTVTEKDHGTALRALAAKAKLLDLDRHAQDTLYNSGDRDAPPKVVNELGERADELIRTLNGEENHHYVESEQFSGPDEEQPVGEAVGIDGPGDGGKEESTQGAIDIDVDVEPESEPEPDVRPEPNSNPFFQGGAAFGSVQGEKES